MTVALGMYLSCAEADKAFATGRPFNRDRARYSFSLSTGYQVGLHRFCDSARFDTGHPAGFAEALDLYFGHTVYLNS
jgi:hypothetical protein